MAQRLMGGAHAGELERAELPAFLCRRRRNSGLHRLDALRSVALPGLERTANEAGPMFEQRQLMFSAIRNRLVSVSDGVLQWRAVNRQEHAADKRCCDGDWIRA